MLCHLNYKIDKEKYRKAFYDNYDKGDYHRKGNNVSKFWYKIFNISEIVEPVTKDLGLENLNILPRFSYQSENSSLINHIDIDRIVGVNLNLFDESPEIIIEGNKFTYESALIDVGSKLHGVIAKEKPRLVLKYAIRNNWNEIYSILDKRGLIDHKKTYLDNPNYKKYESILLDRLKIFVR